LINKKDKRKENIKSQKGAHCMVGEIKEIRVKGERWKNVGGEEVGEDMQAKPPYFFLSSSSCSFFSSFLLS